MGQIFINNASTTLSAGVSDSATSLPLLDATAFPDPGADFYLVTLVGYDVNGIEDEWEIVRVTGKSGSNLTVTRAQESTSAVAWLSATPVQARLTAASVSPSGHSHSFLGISQSFTSNGAITQGDPVVLRSDGDVEAVAASGAVDTFTRYYGAEANPLFNYAASDAAYHFVSRKNTTTGRHAALFIYKDQNSGGGTINTVLRILHYTINSEGEILANFALADDLITLSGTNSAVDVDMCYDPIEDVFWLLYVDQVDAGKLKIAMITEAGENNFTIGTSTDVATNNQSNNNVRIFFDTRHNRPVIFYIDSTYQLRARIAYNNAGTPALGTLRAVGLNAGTAIDFDVAYDSDNEIFLAAYRYSTTFARMIGVYASSSTDVTTVDDQYVHTGSAVAVNDDFRVGYDETELRFVVVFDRAGSARSRHATTTTTGINTFSAEHTLGWSISTIHAGSTPLIYVPSQGKLMFSSTNEHVLLEYSGGNYIESVVFNDPWSVLNYAFSPRTLEFYDDGTIEALVASSSITFETLQFIGGATNLSINPVIGFAQQTVADNASVDVVVSGVDENQSGLSINTTYWFGPDGKLYDFDTGYQAAGVALSATNLLFAPVFLTESGAGVFY